MYITIKLTDNSIRIYATKAEATEHSIEMNKKEDEHPSFELYQSNGRNKAKFVGRLMRDFGREELRWEP